MGDPVLHELDLTDVIRLNIRSLQLFGYLCPEFKTPILKVAYYTYALLFVGFFLILYIVSETVNMILVFGDMEEMSEASFLFLTHLVQAFKLYIFAAHNTKVWRLINSINREEFKPKNQVQYKLLVDDIKTSKIVTKCFLSLGFATVTLWGLSPLYDKKSDEEGIRMPLSGWIPFSTQNSPVFECVYMYLTLGAMIGGLANISMDTFFSGTIMVISGQLKLLNNSFENLKLKYHEKSMKKEEAQNDVRESLIKNIIHHKNILLFADEMTNLFTTGIFTQIVITVIIICIIMFQMSLAPVMTVEFWSMVLYQGCIVLEIFLFCYYGNEVILQSEKLTQSAYMCEWPDCSKEFKNDLLYFMTRSQVPLKLYAGGYFTLSLETFKAIVKSSWSYFAVLNRMHSKKV